MSNPTKLQTFDFNSHALRVIADEHGEPWFIAKDVAEILDYSDAHKMTSRLDNDEVQNRQIRGSEFNNKGTIVINESGLYSAIFGSNKPEAKAFKKHVTSEVLPTIRKTGSYQISHGLDSSKLHALQAENSALLTEYSQLQGKYIALLEEKVAQLSKPKPIREATTEISADEITEILELHAQGWSGAAIAKQLNRSTAAVSYIIRGAKKH